jgi:hypothetical protein
VGTIIGAAMNFLAANIKWIMLVSGTLTCTMVYAAIAPQAALRATFGERFKARSRRSSCAIGGR